ncbi:hypothetical protein GCM10027298_00540 [Epidermidibacterium keratini]
MLRKLISACTTIGLVLATPIIGYADLTSDAATGGSASASNSGESQTILESAASGGAPPGGAQSDPAGSGGGGAADPCVYQAPSDAAADAAASAASAVDEAASYAEIKSYADALAQAIHDQGAKQGSPNWEDGSVVVASCPGGQSGYYAIPEAGAPALPSPAELAVQASASVTVVTPPVVFSPYWALDDGRFATLKNAETWVWIDPVDWSGYAPRVEAGPVWVEATITPIQIVVSPNDGVTEPVTCEGPGTPVGEGVPLSEPSPTCSLRFVQQTDGNSWPVGVQVVYSVSWVGFDGTVNVSGTLENLISAPATYPLAVLSSKTRLVDPNASD